MGRTRASLDGAYDRVVELAKRRGFFWQAYEIYGGVGGLYVLGPLGVAMRERLIDLWRSIFVRRHGFVEIDAPALGPYKVFKASGHVDNFKDPVAECTKCGRKFRADHLLGDAGVSVGEGAPVEELQRLLNENHVKCPECGASAWRVSQFLTMFETRIGPYSEEVGFLRPETAQGIFTEFRRIYDVTRERLPLGVAQIGRGFRNEISPRQAMIRLREFNMMELEFFMDPEAPCPYLEEVMGDELPVLTEEVAERGGDEVVRISVEEALRRGVIKNGCLAYFMALSMRFVSALGVPRDRQRFHGKPARERAHYSAQTFDHEALVPGFGWLEVAGLAYRTDYDLRSHSSASGKDLSASVKLPSPVVVRKVRWRVRSVDELRKAAGDRWKDVMRILSESEDPGRDLAALGLRVEDLPVAKEEVEEKVNVRRFYPHVIEPSYGVERLMLASLTWAYGVREGRVVLSLPPSVAPVQVAVFPLVSRDGLDERARRIAAGLSTSFSVFYDDDGSIGRRYARADEVGVPYAVTVDYETLEDSTVTLRHRDTWKQERLSEQDLPGRLRDLLAPRPSLDHGEQ
ncbi:MAG: glycine--tRNA ligase [Conexivisphaerales archaeon]|nr:glycine--tRNA ligase [Conexivisphaerales archaeon]